MKNILLINVFGEDRPGVTSAITEVLSRYDISLLDIGQAVIHDQLSLAILAAVPSQVNIDLVTDEVKSCLLIMDIRVKFLPISNQAYQNWVEQQGKPRHMVTLLARKIDAIHLALVTTLCANTGLNIDKIVRLSGRMQLDDSDKLGRACVEFSVRGEAQDPRAFRNSLLELASQHNIDIAYQEDNIYRRSRQLVVFDMDSTLIDAEVIDELAKEAGVGDQVAAITEAAMQGKLDFKQSFRQRLELLEGLSVDVLQKVAQRLQLNVEEYPGVSPAGRLCDASDLCLCMRRFGGVSRLDLGRMRLFCIGCFVAVICRHVCAGIGFGLRFVALVLLLTVGAVLWLETGVVLLPCEGPFLCLRSFRHAASTRAPRSLRLAAGQPF